MPKITGTKKQKALELLQRLEDGPSFRKGIRSEEYSPEQARKDYEIWAKSWIIPEAKRLIPELKRMNLDNLSVNLMRGNEDDEGID